MNHTTTYYQVLNECHDHQLSIHQGGGRSGKTTGIIEALIRLAILNNCKGTINIDIFRKHSTTIEKSVYQTFKDVLIRSGIYCHWSYTKKPLEGNLFGAKFRFLGADDEEKIRSTERDIAYINECQELEYNTYESIAMRTRVKILVDFNPAFSADHWIETQLKKEPHHFFKTTYLDNPFLSDNQKNRLISYKDKSDYHYKVFTLGERSDLVGQVFDNWEIAQLPNFAELIGYGVDWGYVNDPTTLIGVYKYENKLYFDEMIYETNLTTLTNVSAPQLVSFQSKLEKCNVSKKHYIICDNSDSKSIVELRNVGYLALPTIKDKDSIINGINLLKSFTCFVTTHSSNLIKEKQNYVWKVDKNTNISKNETVDCYNHAIDAIRYFVYSTYKKFWHL